MYWNLPNTGNKRVFYSRTVPQFSRCLKFLHPSLCPSLPLSYKHVRSTGIAVPSSQSNFLSVKLYSEKWNANTVESLYLELGYSNSAKFEASIRIKNTIHFDRFLQPKFGSGYLFTSPNYPKCK